jgi:hypothetical protein
MPKTAKRPGHTHDILSVLHVQYLIRTVDTQYKRRSAISAEDYTRLSMSKDTVVMMKLT